MVKLFMLKGDVQKCLSVHSCVKKFGCHECGKLLMQKDELQKHLFVNFNVKNLDVMNKGNFCGKINFKKKVIILCTLV